MIQWIKDLFKSKEKDQIINMKKIIVNLRYDINSMNENEKLIIIEELKKRLNSDDIIVFFNSLENRIYTVNIPRI